jgi:hypothetical protein
MRAGRRVVMATTAVFLAMGTVPAAAADLDGDAYVDDAGNPTAEARDVIQTGGRSGGGRESTCFWRVVIEDDREFGVYEVDGSRRHSDTGRWLEQVCDGQPIQVVPEGAPVDPRQLAVSARESVAIPTPPLSTSPSADRELYPQMKTWLWVDDSWWQPYSATAEAGAVSATVTARPVRSEWSMGDDGRTVCAGPGVEWRRGMSEDDTYCSYTYRRSSAGEPGGTFTLTVTVVFEVTWSSSTGAGGSLGALTRSASTPVRVGEIQAVHTR